MDLADLLSGDEASTKEPMDVDAPEKDEKEEGEAPLETFLVDSSSGDDDEEEIKKKEKK